ncbi:MAG: hypothetical protein ACPLZA_03040 [Thermodesulfovibrio sp.]|uniref:Uncharacterized protein n=1 Tax=Thermodesulfovibrio aggregans TaxID=86166 RepID=A0A2J6WKZ4_9BACT|nr:MAG: hypothetical protein C0186_04400 [Thermodesulfovibrio aggregans]
MKKVWKKMKDLLVSITLSKPKEFDRICEKEKTKKKGGGKRKILKCFV